MGQRINIQYSIDIDELDTEVHRILTEGLKSLEELSDTDVDWYFDTLSLDTLNSIDLFRKKLAAVDFKLRDASVIISSYLSYKANESIETQPGEPSEDPS